MPGHERFVPTMLAGVGPVPAVLLVVAADEGWMPQSAEHLAALDALGVRHGLLAVTRSDLADPAPAAARARAEVGGDLARRGRRRSRSARRTGAGLADLRAALDRLLAGLPVPDPGAPVRLWVDRAFTVRGSGTVVTGTLGAGTLRVGDELELVPGGRRVRRARPAVAGRAGRRGDGDRAGRGEPARRAGRRGRPAARRWSRRGSGRRRRSWTSGWPACRWPSCRPSWCCTSGRRRCRSGSVRSATDTLRLRLARALPLHVGDRVLLRDPGRRLVAGGLRVLDVDPPPLRRRGAAAARAAELSTLDGRPDGTGELRRRGAVRAAALRAMGVPEPAGAGAGRGLAGRPRPLRRGWRAALAARWPAHAAAHPLEHGLPVEAARQRLGLPDARLVPALLADPPGADPAAPPPAGVGLVVRDGRVTTAAADAAAGRAAGGGGRGPGGPGRGPVRRPGGRTGWPSWASAAASWPPRSGPARCCGWPTGSYLLPGADDRAAELLAGAAPAVHAVRGAPGARHHPAGRRAAAGAAGPARR